MKNFLNKIEFSNYYLLMALSFILIGYYKNLLIFTTLIIIHELGHAISASFFKVKINKIIIYPYGGLTKLDNYLNIKINKELIISISGLLSQTLFYYLMIFINNKYHFFNDYTINILTMYHKSMFIFNLLPVIPLDGSKILLCILNRIFPYNLSNYLSIYISFITLIISIYIIRDNINYTYIMTLCICLKNIYNFYKECTYLFNKFILERYLYQFNFKHIKVIKDYHNMYKDYNHIIKDKTKYQKEADFLTKMFDIHKYLW